MTQHIAVAEAPVPILGKCRVIWNWIRQIHLAEPTIGEVQMDLFAQTTFWPNAHDVSQQQHPHHQFWINRGPSSGAVKICQMRPNAGQINNAINSPQNVIAGDVVFYREIIEQSKLCFLTWSHHRDQSSTSIRQLNQQQRPKSTKVFQQNRLKADDATTRTTVCFGWDTCLKKGWFHSQLELRAVSKRNAVISSFLPFTENFPAFCRENSWSR
mmetsp:Transcript_24384/g.45415  ORF Transcript_24384/g.45415 Transcript_24384/m.45415 type:complete len:213 (+) Transcript_24384:109-747(+)